MGNSYNTSNKYSETKWDKFELYQSEPRISKEKEYDLSPEQEAELFDHAYFLKARVRHNMRKMHGQYPALQRSEHLKRHYHSPHKLKLA